MAAQEYYKSLNMQFNLIAKKYKMPSRIPISPFKDIFDENDLAVIILEHIDYFLKIEGKPSPFSYAAYSISKLKEPLSSLKGELKKIKGVGETTEKIILEILKTGSSCYYEKLANQWLDKF